MMNTLLADSSLGAEQILLVANALHLINTTNVLQPDLDGQIKAGQVSIDRDTEAWLFTELAQRERTYTANVNKTKDALAAGTAANGAGAAGSGASTGGAAAEKPYYMSGLNFDFNPFDAILEGLGLDVSSGTAGVGADSGVCVYELRGLGGSVCVLCGIAWALGGIVRVSGALL